MRPHATLLVMLAKTKAFEQSRRDRKKVEMLFAHLKRILRLDRLRLRGPTARSSSSRWRRSRKTSAGSQSWSHDRRRSREPRALRGFLHGIRSLLLEFALLRTEQDDTRRRSQDSSWPATGITGDFYNKIDP